MNKKIVLGVFASFIAFVLTMAYIANLNGPWRGQVIDAETKQPIEGAAVVAVWHKEFMLDPAGGGSSYLDAAETVTDKDGRFNISARRFLSIPMIRQLRGPHFTIYKPGYGSFPSNQVSPKYTPETLFEGKGAVVELPELNLKTREERLKYLPSTPSGIWGHEDKIEQFNRLLDKEINSINSLDNK